jgi:hypothetical protein
VVNLLAIQPGVAYLGAQDQPALSLSGNGHIVLNDPRSGAVDGGKSDQGNVTLDGVDVNDQQDLLNAELFANKGGLCRIKCERSIAICESFRERRLRSRPTLVQRLTSAKGFDWVMIGHWARRFTQSTIFQPTIFFGESNGSAALATTRVFQATP